MTSGVQTSIEVVKAVTKPRFFGVGVGKQAGGRFFYYDTDTLPIDE
jgi:hypothetical protein